MTQAIISVDTISKRYLVGHRSADRERYTALRDVIGREARNFARKAFDFARGRQIIQADDVEQFWALRDVSFEIMRGDVIGVIGRNGAGKSTLLKILSRITEPTTGRVVLRGRVASLLEVGTGFHPELTGRENIFLNGAILGMAQNEIRSKFDAIVDFAGIERFLDTPVKHYSSGMYVRLAFAVAAHLEPEILVVDEVLAVGDAEFQRKCLGKMQEVAAMHGRTVLFVSHNMEAIRALCTRGILLNHGKVAFAGSAEACIDEYLAENHSIGANQWCRVPSEANAVLGFRSISIELAGAQPHQLLHIDCSFVGEESHPPAMVAFDITEMGGYSLMQALPAPRPFLRSQVTNKRIRFTVQLPPLVPGKYWVSAWLGPHYTETFDFRRECVSFEIKESPTPGRTFPHTRDHGFVVPNCTHQVVE